MRKILILLTFLVFGTTLVAQSWPISVSFVDESIAFPSHRLIKSPLHPGFTVGTEFPNKKFDSDAEWGLRAEIGAYFHERVENAVFLNGSAYYRQPIYWELYAEGGAGAGYLHSFYPSTIWEQQPDGGFSIKEQKGRPHAIATVDLGLGYDLSPQWTVFIRYQLMVETPFASTIPVIPHTLFSMGAKFHLFPEASF